jgi:hypothetical protein|tara:strand:- start:593 stop:811 length:219 start_codon:yes stop_codon:yes gene_type:complete
MNATDREGIEKQLVDYRKQEEVALTNVHRVQGARIALELLLKEMGSPSTDTTDNEVIVPESLAEVIPAKDAK